MHIYRQKTIIFLMGYLLIFLIIFLLCLSNLSSKRSLFDIGMDPTLQNWILMLFSLAAMIKVVIEIAKTESHAEYEKKLRDLSKAHN